ncbi:MAG: ECF transporter S component [Oscillospiraceae bacterium]|nr:ECF transporter S component [Oscillospiraceae bacterium]
MNSKEKIKNLAITGIFSAIIFILAFTPIGFIPLPFVRATTIHIPVIVGALLLGPRYGAVLGFMFGFASLLNNTFNPTITSFVFSPFYNMPGEDSGSWLSLIVVFVPRILVGVFPPLVYAALKKLLKNKEDIFCMMVSGVVGSLTNTLLVMHLIFLFFGEAWNSVRAEPAEVVYTAIIGIITTNGVLEAIVAGILTAAICKPLMAIKNNTKG